MYKVLEYGSNGWIELANDFITERLAWKFIAQHCIVTGKSFDNFKVEKVGEVDVQK